MLSQVLLGHGPVAGALRCAVTTWGDSAVECVVPELPAGSYGVRLLLPGGLTPPAPQDFRAELQLDAVTESARAHSYSLDLSEEVLCNTKPCYFWLLTFWLFTVSSPSIYSSSVKKCLVNSQ